MSTKTNRPTQNVAGIRQNKGKPSDERLVESVDECFAGLDSGCKPTCRVWNVNSVSILHSESENILQSQKGRDNVPDGFKVGLEVVGCDFERTKDGYDFLQHLDFVSGQDPNVPTLTGVQLLLEAWIHIEGLREFRQHVILAIPSGRILCWKPESDGSQHGFRIQSTFPHVIHEF